MEFNILDIVIILVYFSLILLICLIQGQSKDKKNSPRIPAYNTSILVILVISSWITTSNIFFTPKKIFEEGIIFILILLGDILSMLAASILIIPKIEDFGKAVSIGDIISKIYGNSSRFYAGLLAILTLIAELSLQSTIIAYILEYFFEINFDIGLLIGTSIIILYYNFGREKTIKAVYLLYLFMLLITLPIICNVSVLKVGGYQNLINGIKYLSINMDLTQIDYSQFIGSFILFSLPNLNPNNIQRLLKGNSVKQMVSVLKYVTLIGVLFYICIILITLSFSVLEPYSDFSLVMSYFVKEGLPDSIRGLAIIGLIAVIIASAESTLSSSTTCLVHDIIKPLSKNKLTDITEFNLSQACIIIVAILSVIISFKFEITLLVVLLHKIMWLSVVNIPLILGINKYNIQNSSLYIFISFSIILLALIYACYSENLTITSASIIGILSNFIFCLYLNFLGNKKAKYLSDKL